MLSTNSPIDWTNFMSHEDRKDFVKTPEFREWLIDILSQQSIVVSFTKKDGTERVMNCTRSLTLIPEESHPKTGSADTESSIRAFDLDKGEWRSFIIENIKRIEYKVL